MERDRKRRKRILQALLASVTVPAVLSGQAALAADDAQQREKEILLRLDSSLASVNRILVPIDAENRAAAPFLEQSTTFVPLRFVSETLGVPVSWEPATQSVTMATYGGEIRLAVGSGTMMVGGRAVQLPVPPILRGETTFVPLRSIAESLGSRVDYSDGYIRIAGKKADSPSAAVPLDPEKLAPLKQGMPFLVYQNGTFLDGFSSQEQASAYAKRLEKAVVKNREGTVVWDSFPAFRVYQNGNFLDAFDSYVSALGYAKKYGNSAVQPKSGRNPVWTSAGPSAVPTYIEVPDIRQFPELPRGCEVTALAMLLNFAGVPVDKMTLAAEIRRDPTPYRQKNDIVYFGNPDRGFVGDMYTFANPGFGVYHGPIFELAERYLPGRAVDLSGVEFDDILQTVERGMPVWVISNEEHRALPSSEFRTWQSPDGPVWLTMKEHSVVIVGCDEDYVYIRDPLALVNRVAKTAFKAGWEQMGKQAVTVLPKA